MYFNLFVLVVFISNVVIGTPEQKLTHGQSFGIGESVPISKDDIIDVSVSTEEAERSTLDTIQLTVALVNGTDAKLTLKLTDGILANHDTPVWDAEGESLESDNITYTRNYEAMKDVGDFSFYQNYTYKAAVTLFHKHNTMRGVIGLYEFETNVTLYQSHRSAPTTTPSSNKLQPGNKTIYPELLIILDKDYVGSNLQEALQKVLSYWNNVDMLFSGFQRPPIKLNIAEIIIPKNDYATPWFNNADFDSKRYINEELAVDALLTYCIEKRNCYDFVISSSSMPIHRLERKWQGIEIRFLTFTCFIQVPAAAFINYDNDSYAMGAQELGNLLYIPYDKETILCQQLNGIMGIEFDTTEADLSWSRCSRQYFSNAFGHEEVECLENCPYTAPNCKVESQVGHSALISSTVSNAAALHCVMAASFFWKICIFLWALVVVF